MKRDERRKDRDLCRSLSQRQPLHRATNQFQTSVAPSASRFPAPVARSWWSGAYLFANKRGNRMKVLIHDGLGIWLCARRLNRGKFHWGEAWRGDQLRLTEEQLFALVEGLPWQRLGAGGVISIL